MSSEYNPDSYAELYAATEANVLLIDENRANADRTYDDFMWQYVGHPRLHALPELTRWRNGYGEVSFDIRDDCGYTENGTLVLIRQSSALPLDDPDSLAVMTADLEAHEIREWRVAEIHVYETYARSAADRELILEPLHDRMNEVLAIDESRINSGNARRDELDRRHLQRLQRERLAARASILETTQGRWFIHAGQREMLSNIYELDMKLKTYYQRLGDLAIRQRENPQTYGAEAATIEAA
jgi:hypothetical protein